MAGVKGKMSSLKRLISFDEATLRVRSKSWKRLEVIEVDVEYSLDLIAAEDVKSEVDVPPYDRSAMDGYAVRHSDLNGASSENPVSLHLIGNENWKEDLELKKGECLQVNTGGKIPRGADSVIMKEYATPSGSSILVEKPLRAWENVSRKGEDIQSGMKVVVRGETILSWHVASLIAIGRKRVLVFAPIRLGVISTGNEIVHSSRSGVKNTTQPLLINYFTRGSIKPTDEGIYPDDYDEIKNAVLGALEREDVLVVTGGSSVGERDVSGEVLADIGEVIFRGIMIRPGRTVSMFSVRDTPVYLVSGLPVAALTSFEALFERYLSEVCGFRENRKVIRAKLTGRIINNVGMRSFVRVMLSRSEDSLDAKPLQQTGSGILSTLLESNGLTVVPENVEGMNEGDYIWVTVTGGPV